jgi:hypothetical protein
MLIPIFNKNQGKGEILETPGSTTSVSACEKQVLKTLLKCKEVFAP